MRLSASILAAVLVAFANSGPVSFPEYQELEARKSYGTSANEYTTSGCNTVIMFFARGSTQDGNIGDMPGQQLATSVSAVYGTKLYVQGIDYPATLEGNFDPGRCPEAYAKKMGTLITQAATKCPNAQLIVAGYSQGAAMVHASMKTLTAATVEHIAAAVTFGDTYFQQDGNIIPNIPAAKTKIFCNKGDLVCNGTLDITSAHTNYRPSVAPATTFIQSKVTLT